ncbi:hypothetical protein G6F57_022384 [Rhizopus arrhizus]|nr:hypothetical protein G6F57_022384 [Rhizopus arrhizus]
MRFQHAAVAGFAASLFAGRGAQDADAVGAQLFDVALRGRVGPHLAVHRGRHQKRTGARQAQRGQQVIGHAVRQLRHEVGAGGGDQHGVRAAREVDVRHVVGHARIPRCVAASVITTSTVAPCSVMRRTSSAIL